MATQAILGKNVLIQLAATAGGSGLSFLILSASARIFGPKILGEAAYLVGILGLIFAFTDLGLSRAHVHLTASGSGRPALTTFLALKLPLLLAAALAATGLYYWQSLPGIFLVFLIVEMFSRLADGILISFEGQEKAWPQNLLRTGVKICRLAAILILGRTMVSVAGYSLTFLTESILLVAGAAFLGRHWWQFKVDRRSIKTYVQYSLPFAVIIPLSYLQENGLLLLLKNLQNSEVLGVFVAAFGLFGFLKTFSSSLMTFFFPRMSRLNQTGDIAKIQVYTDTAVKYSFWLMLPVLLVLFLVSHWLVPLVLGPEFIAGVGIFRWYIAGMLILSLFTPYDHVLFATNNQRSIIGVNLAMTILLLLLAWQLIPIWGGAGAAAATVMTWLVGGWWQFLILRQKTGIRFLQDWRINAVEVKYFYEIIHSFGSARFWPGRKKTS